MNPNELTPSLTRLDSIRHLTLVTGEDSGSQSYPFRQGADPEMHQGDNPDALTDLLTAKARMSVANLGYKSESIGILCSRSTHLAIMAEKLAGAGFDSAVVKDGVFEFHRRGVVRLSTLHYSKGLNSPVVLIYVPELPPAKEIDPPYQYRLYRNLQYVAMSRGMDVVESFNDH